MSPFVIGHLQNFDVQYNKTYQEYEVIEAQWIF